MLNNIFVCNGFVTEIQYYRGTPEGIAYVGIWQHSDETEFTLRERIEIPPADTGLQTFVLDTPVYAEAGDFIGVHYPRNSRGGVVMSATPSDNAVSENELYQTYELEVFDDEIRPGVPVLADTYSGVQMRKTFALHAKVQYEDDGSEPVITTSGNWCIT